MALAKTVTKVFPTENTVGLHLKLTDDDRADLGPGEQTVIDADFMEQFAPGEDIPNEVRDKIGARMQAAIDRYKGLKTTFEKNVYETVRTQVDNNLAL